MNFLILGILCLEAGENEGFLLPCIYAFPIKILYFKNIYLELEFNVHIRLHSHVSLLQGVFAYSLIFLIILKWDII